MCKYKILIIGEISTGKSSLASRYVDNIFHDKEIATIGIDMRCKNVLLSSDKVSVQFWDTSGHERFRALTRSYYRGSHGVIVMFDVTNRDSFDKVQSWIDESKTHCDSTVNIILIGNKIDDIRTVTSKEGMEIAIKNNIQYFEISNKLNINVEYTLEYFILMIHTTYIKSLNDKTITLSKPKLKKWRCNIL